MVRRINVFFYGLFMDAELLRQKGVQPENPRRSGVRGYSLRLGKRATLVPDSRGRVHGMVMALTQDEIEQLYSDQSVRAYKPEAVLCDLEDGSRIPALCFTLPEPPPESERNPEYAAKLRDLAQRLQLPRDYITEIANLAS